MLFENTLHYSTFADRSQVENRIESYDTLMVPSHLLIGGKNAIPPLIHNLYDSGPIEYYVDPAITEFHKGESFCENGELKSWHEKLVNELGEPLKGVIERNNNLDYQNLSEEDRDAIIEDVCDLQTDFVQDTVEDQMGKYESALLDEIRPKAVIPWYVKIQSSDQVKVNRQIISKTKGHTDLPVKPCLHVEKDFLRDTEARKSLVSMLDDLDIEYSFLWIEDLNKKETSVDEYINVIRLVIEIAAKDILPHFMYGDFFANILTYFGLRGTGFGTYHQEDKAEKVESTGGGNLQRYYFNPIKEFLSIPDAAKLGRLHNAEVPEHSGLKSWDRLYKLGEDHDFLKNHFIRSKDHHRRRTLSEDLNNITEELKGMYETYEEPLEKLETTKTADHLHKWAKAVSLYQQNYPEESARGRRVADEKLESDQASLGMR